MTVDIERYFKQSELIPAVIQEHGTGQVKLKLYKSNTITAGLTAPESLYTESLVTFEESDGNRADATGFINRWGLPETVQALREQGKLKK